MGGLRRHLKIRNTKNFLRIGLPLGKILKNLELDHYLSKEGRCFSKKKGLDFMYRN